MIATYQATKKCAEFLRWEMDKKRSHYWDSCVFLAWLNDDPEQAPKCEGVLDAADQGKLRIVTSALTITEVLFTKGYEKIDIRDRDKVEALFKSSFITVIDVSRFIAEHARELVWTNDVRPKDSIHVSSAIYAKVDEFNTFDEKLLSLNNKVGDNPLSICIPSYPLQGALGLTVNEEEEEGCIDDDI